MTDTGVLDLAQRAIVVTMLMSAPVLGVGLVVGLLVSVFQAATQIQEMTLTFVPKIVAVAAVLVLVGPWMLRSMVNFTSKLLVSLPNMVH